VRILAIRIAVKKIVSSGTIQGVPGGAKVKAVLIKNNPVSTPTVESVISPDIVTFAFDLEESGVRYASISNTGARCTSFKPGIGAGFQAICELSETDFRLNV
jgi:hypothetical protein